MAAVTEGDAVRVRVPASTANLGPGFDSMGLAVGLWDTYDVRLTDGEDAAESVVGEGSSQVPRDGRHLVIRSMRHAWQVLGVAAPVGISLSAINSVPHSRGLGSSATAIVGGVSAALALARPGELDLATVADIASDLEGHPDNATASVYGGCTLSWPADDSASGHSTCTVRPRLHPDVDLQVWVPNQELSTALARSVLPAHVPLADAARNSARVGLLVHALTADPAQLLAATRDYLHQQARRESYADSMALVDRLRADGQAAVISGAGPTVVVLGERSGLDAIDTAVVSADVGTAWRVLRPGIPTQGATLERL